MRCHPQFFSVDFSKSQDDELLRVGGSVKVAESFERLAWGAVGLNPSLYPVREQCMPVTDNICC